MQVFNFEKIESITLQNMLSGFRDWECFGLVEVNPEEGIGVDIDGTSLCAVYGKRKAERQESDDSNEMEMIRQGKYAIILFLGDDNISFMRRMSPEDYDCLVLEKFEQLNNDLFYNS